MIVRQIAVLADAVRVVGTFRMRTLVCEFVAPHHVVTVLAHAFRIEGFVCVWAFCHILLA